MSEKEFFVIIMQKLPLKPLYAFYFSYLMVGFITRSFFNTAWSCGWSFVWRRLDFSCQKILIDFLLIFPQFSTFLENPPFFKIIILQNPYAYLKLILYTEGNYLLWPQSFGWGCQTALFSTFFGGSLYFPAITLKNVNIFSETSWIWTMYFRMITNTFHTNINYNKEK